MKREAKQESRAEAQKNRFHSSNEAREEFVNKIAEMIVELAKNNSE